MKAVDGTSPISPVLAAAASAPKKNWSWLSLVGLGVIALFPILLGGIDGYAFWKARQSIKEEVQQSLATIAEQKIRQIEFWLSGLSQDAMLFSEQTSLSEIVEKWINDGKRDEALEKAIRVRLEQILENRHYSNLSVFDAQGQAIFQIGESDMAAHSQLARDVIRLGKPQFVDLHHNGDGQIALGMVSPFITLTGHAIATLFFEVKADDYLYPLLQSWPVPHATAETILARRKGENIEYVSPLYLLGIPAMTLQESLHIPQRPVTAALHGFRGIYQNGVDYRLQPVLSYVAPVQGTPWIMVAKMDKTEAYARIHRLGWYSGAAFAITLFASYWIVWLVWRNHRLQNRLAVKQELYALNQQLEQRVRERTQELQSVLDTARDGFVVLLFDGHVVKVNPAFSQMLGYSEEELQTMSVTDFDVQEDSALTTAHFGRIRNKGGDSFQTQLRRKDGKVIDVDVSATYLDQQGGILFSFIRDITDRKRAERENLRLAAIIDASIDLIAITDAKGSITYFNPAGRKLLGIGPTEMLENTGIHDYQPDWSYQIVSQIGLPCAIRRGIWMGDTAFLTQEGLEVPVSQMVIAKKKTDGSGEVEFFATIARNISERKKAEAVLKEREETFRRIFQDSLDPALLMKGIRFVECNQAALDLLRLAKEELMGLSPADISPEYQDNGRRSADMVNEIKDTVDVGDGLHFDWHCLRKDGSDFYVEVSLTPIKINGSPFFYCSWRDISERRHIVETLAVAKQAAEAANRAKSAFLANMSHEIRTPLNSILGKAQLIQSEGLDERAKNQIKSIYTAAQHLLAIVNDILDISKIEAGKLKLEMSDLPLQEKIEGVLNMFAEKVDGSGIALGFAIDPSLPPVIRGDELRIRQMLFNLVGNAVKFTENGTVTVRVLRMSPGDENFQVRFEVHDTGVGVSPENQQRLFNHFEQADNQSTRKYGGTGLGLAICKRLAEQMGGSIGVTSAIGSGSTFWFTIPLSKGLQTSIQQDNNRSTEEFARRLAQHHSDARVLLVEDNVINQEIAIELLQEVGITVDLAADGVEGVSRATAQAYDLILMDIQMPKMDGLEATRLIRRLPGRSNVPIVAISANAFADDIARYLEAGMNGHIAKPVVLKELYETVLHCLDGSAFPGKDAGSAALPTAAPANSPEAGVMKRLAAIPGLDPQVGINSLAGKTASYIRLLRKFAERQSTEMANLRQAMTEADSVTAKRITHTLKGLAGTMGALSLQASVECLDAAIRDKLEAEEIGPLSETVMAEYAVLAEAILTGLTDP